AAADAALDLDPAAVRLGEMLDDGEAQAAAALVAGAALVHPVEALEDASQRLRRDADAGVADLDQRVAALPRQAQQHLAARPVVLDGVVEQVEEQPLDAVGVAGQARQRLVAQLQTDALLARRRRQPLEGALAE